MEVLTPPFLFDAYDNKIFLSGRKGGTIDVFDTGMKKLFTITVDMEKQKITQDFKDKVIHELKTSPETKDVYDRLFKPVQFPEYLPAMQDFFCVDKRVYVMTWKKENEKTVFLLYDMNGKFLKKKDIPLKYQTIRRPYPVTIRNGKLYQLVENIEGEEWDLYVEEIK
jgi:hypothetical protein